MFKMKTFEGALIFQIQHHFLDLRTKIQHLHTLAIVYD